MPTTLLIGKLSENNFNSSFLVGIDFCDFNQGDYWNGEEVNISNY